MYKLFTSSGIIAVGFFMGLFGKLELARNGQTQYVIIINTNSTPAEKTAAQELSDYLAKVTGGRFEVMSETNSVLPPRAIYVGWTDFARKQGIDGSTLGDEELVVRRFGKNLVLTGGRPRGTLYAVYAFLEDEAGIQWFNWWGDEYAPRREKLAVGALNRRATPAFRVRDIVAHTARGVSRTNLLEFLVRNRCQGPELGFLGGMDSYGGNSHSYVIPPQAWLVHTFFWFISPPGEYKGHGKTPDIFEKHPEYFSFIGGKRIPAQLCFSNPEVRKLITDRILQQFKEVGGKGTLSLSAQDSPGALCECPDCLKLTKREQTTGAPLFDFLAELSPVLKAKYPEAFMSTLAYRKKQTEIPPKNITLPENIIIIFAAIDDNFAAPVDHPSNADTLKNLKGWKGAAKNLWVWYYPNPYGNALPIGNLRRMADDFKTFKNIGVNGFFIEQDGPGVYDSRRMADLQTWLIARLMWDPNQDLDALVADFTGRYYGPAAPFIRQYITVLEQATAAMCTSMGWNAGTGQYHFLTPRLLLACQQLLDQAEQAVARDPELLARTERVRMSIDLACIMKWDGLAASGAAPFTRARIIERYRDTYTRTINNTCLPEHRKKLLESMENSLKWHIVKTELKPLPPPLDAVPPERIRQITPETASLEGGNSERVADPLAAAGIAATMKVSGQPFNMGFYDVLTTRQQPANLSGDKIKPGEYHLYFIGQTALNAECYVWFDSSWCVQFRDVAGLYAVDAPERKWDLYASIRFEGPAYAKTGRETNNCFYVDRVVLVEADK